jgi:predicted PurR-regulated permease PerM
MILLIALVALVTGLIYYGVTTQRPIYLAAVLAILLSYVLLESMIMNRIDAKGEPSPRQICAGEPSPQNPCR